MKNIFFLWKDAPFYAVYIIRNLIDNTKYKIKLITKASEKIPEGSAFLTFKKEYTYVYGDNWIVD